MLTNKQMKGKTKTLIKLANKANESKRLILESKNNMTKRTSVDRQT